jgi:DNA invertase Pin-like site-specific DNA recombinase
MKKLNVAIYARVSSKDKGQDYENQLIDLRSFVERKADEGWTLGEIYTDKVSAKLGSTRPAFNRMMVDASEKRFDLILFWSLDRFSREGVYETFEHLRKLSNYGVDWFSLKEEYLRSVGVFKEAVLAIISAIAKQERVRISERTLAGLARARRAGRVGGRPRAKLTDDGKPVGLARVLELRQQPSAKLPDRPKGLREIADNLGVSVMTVSRMLKV